MQSRAAKAGAVLLGSPATLGSHLGSLHLLLSTVSLGPQGFQLSHCLAAAFSAGLLNLQLLLLQAAGRA
jgi:hypothetical protein